MQNIYAQAIACQDAVNPRALARLLVTAADQANGDYNHPAFVLIVNKIESLARSNDMDRFSKAWDLCTERLVEHDYAVVVRYTLPLGSGVRHTNVKAYCPADAEQTARKQVWNQHPNACIDYVKAHVSSWDRGVQNVSR